MDGHGRAVARGAVDRQLAVMGVDQGFDDRQTQALAVPGQMGVVADLGERFSDGRQLFRRNADPVVAHADGDVIVRFLRRHHHMAARGRVFDGVGDQVGDDLDDADMVAENPQVRGGHFQPQVDLFAFGLGDERLSADIEQRQQFVERFLNGPFPGLDLGDIQDIVDQRQHDGAA